jgi:hypothetical protein
MDGAEPPFSFLIIDERLEEFPAPEIRPQDRRDPDLGIGDLPEQKIGDPELPARPDEQVGIRNSRRIQVSRKTGFVQTIRIDSRVLQDFFHGTDNLGPAAVIDGQNDSQTVMGASHCFYSFKLSLDSLGNSLSLADDNKPDLVFYHLFILFLEVFLEQPPEQGDLSLRPFPILLGKGVKSQEADAQTGTGFDNLLNGFRAGPVPLDPRLPALFRPAAIPVHDNGDVPGKPGRVQLQNEFFFFASGRNETVEVEFHGLIIRATPRKSNGAGPGGGNLVI